MYKFSIKPIITMPILIYYFFQDSNNNNLQYHKQYKAVAISKPTPLPDVIEESETEFPLPNSNQPILVK